MENAFKTSTGDMKNDPALKGPRPMLDSSAGHNIMESANEFASKFKNVSGEYVRDTVDFVKQYPVHTALGAAAIGFAAGFMMRGSRK